MTRGRTEVVRGRRLLVRSVAATATALLVAGMAWTTPAGAAETSTLDLSETGDVGSPPTISGSVTGLSLLGLGVETTESITITVTPNAPTGGRSVSTNGCDHVTGGSCNTSSVSFSWAPALAYNGPYTVTASAKIQPLASTASFEPRQFRLAADPVAPADLKVETNADRRALLSWQRNPEPDILYYQVFRKAPGGSFSRVGGDVRQPDSGRVTFTDLSTAETQGGEFAYRVVAVRNGASGDSTTTTTSRASADRAVTVAAPPPPVTPPGPGAEPKPAGADTDISSYIAGQAPALPSPKPKFLDLPDTGFDGTLPFGQLPEDMSEPGDENATPASLATRRLEEFNRGRPLIPIAAGAILLLLAAHLRLFNKRLKAGADTRNSAAAAFIANLDAAKAARASGAGAVVVVGSRHADLPDSSRMPAWADFRGVTVLPTSRDGEEPPQASDSGMAANHRAALARAGSGIDHGDAGRPPWLPMAVGGRGAHDGAIAGEAEWAAELDEAGAGNASAAAELDDEDEWEAEDDWPAATSAGVAGAERDDEHEDEWDGEAAKTDDADDEDEWEEDEPVAAARLSDLDDGEALLAKSATTAAERDGEDEWDVDEPDAAAHADDGAVAGRKAADRGWRRWRGPRFGPVAQTRYASDDVEIGAAEDDVAAAPMAEVAAWASTAAERYGEDEAEWDAVDEVDEDEAGWGVEDDEPVATRASTAAELDDEDEAEWEGEDEVDGEAVSATWLDGVSRREHDGAVLARSATAAAERDDDAAGEGEDELEDDEAVPASWLDRVPGRADGEAMLARPETAAAGRKDEAAWEGEDWESEDWESEDEVDGAAVPATWLDRVSEREDGEAVPAKSGTAAAERDDRAAGHADGAAADADDGAAPGRKATDRRWRPWRGRRSRPAVPGRDAGGADVESAASWETADDAVPTRAGVAARASTAAELDDEDGWDAEDEVDEIAAEWDDEAVATRARVAAELDDEDEAGWEDEVEVDGDGAVVATKLDDDVEWEEDDRVAAGRLDHVSEWEADGGAEDVAEQDAAAQDHGAAAEQKDADRGRRRRRGRRSGPVDPGRYDTGDDVEIVAELVKHSGRVVIPDLKPLPEFDPEPVPAPPPAATDVEAEAEAEVAATPPDDFDDFEWSEEPEFVEPEIEVFVGPRR